MSSEVLNLCKDEDSRTPRDRLGQCLTTLTVKTVFLCTNGISYIICAHCLFPCPWALLRVCLPFLHFLPSGTHCWHLLRWAFTSPSWISQLSQPLLTGEAFHYKSHLSGPPLDLCSTTMPLLYWGALNWTKHSRRSFTTTEQSWMFMLFTRIS